MSKFMPKRFYEINPRIFTFWGICRFVIGTIGSGFKQADPNNWIKLVIAGEPQILIKIQIQSRSRSRSKIISRSSPHPDPDLDPNTDQDQDPASFLDAYFTFYKHPY